MRRALIITLTALTLAACSPYDTPADATPDQAITTSTVRSGPPMLDSAPRCDRDCGHTMTDDHECEVVA